MNYPRLYLTNPTGLERAENRIQMLMQRAAEAEAEAMSGIAVGDKPPPHW